MTSSARRDETLSLHEAAEALGVHYMTAYRYVRLGVLPAHREGRSWRVRRVDLDTLGEETPPAQMRKPADWDRRFVRLSWRETGRGPGRSSRVPPPDRHGEFGGYSIGPRWSRWGVVSLSAAASRLVVLRSRRASSPSMARAIFGSSEISTSRSSRVI